MVRAVALALLAATAACGPLVLEADPLTPTRDGGFTDGGFADSGVARDGGFIPRDGGPSHAADVNSDGCVDGTDLDLVQARWGETSGAADANDDGEHDVSDAIKVFEFLFSRVRAPPAPGPFECGVDLTEDSLTCEVTTCR